MKLRTLFTINMPIAAVIGFACAAFPRQVIALYGLAPDIGAVWVTRLVGGSILGFATLMWHGRSAAAVETRRAIALALLIQDVIGCLASVAIQLTGAVNAVNLPSTGLYGFLALGYAWFLFVRPDDA